VHEHMEVFYLLCYHLNCIHLYHATYRISHLEALNLYHATYRISHLEALNLYHATYRTSHLEALNLYHATYRISHLEALNLSVWIYLVFGNISERNLSCHLSTVKALLPSQQ
jgi:uncharacterized protein YjbI with pentapeptide repeats